MKPIKYIVCIVVLAFLAGCTTAFRPWLLSDVKEGMDRQEVIAILGTPDSSEIQGEAEYLYYSYAEGYNPSFSDHSIEDDQAFKKMRDKEFEQSLSEYKYVVTLIDDKMQGYKEVTD